MMLSDEEITHYLNKTFFENTDFLKACYGIAFNISFIKDKNTIDDVYQYILEKLLVELRGNYEKGVFLDISPQDARHIALVKAKMRAKDYWRKESGRYLLPEWFKEIWMLPSNKLIGIFFAICRKQLAPQGIQQEILKSSNQEISLDEVTLVMRKLKAENACENAKKKIDNSQKEDVEEIKLGNIVHSTESIESFLHNQHLVSIILGKVTPPNMDSPLKLSLNEKIIIDGIRFGLSKKLIAALIRKDRKTVFNYEKNAIKKIKAYFNRAGIEVPNY